MATAQISLSRVCTARFPIFFVWESKCYYKVCSISRDLVRTRGSFLEMVVRDRSITCLIVHTIELFSNGVRMVVSIVALG